MTYDIMLVRIPADSTLHEAVNRLNADFDPDADLPLLRLTDVQRAAWDRILDRVSGEIGAVESAEYLYSLTFETVGPPGRVQFDYCGDTAGVEVAYRHSGAGASAVMEPAYRIARIAEEESGLTGYDFEVDQPVRTGDPARAAARMSAVSDWARHHLS
ncbi:hypothetical protein ACFWVT_03205 [Streptomyces cyaneofuscatus]|uniref:hypothetical protein n=1 Tax=Streptomyces cyaneofuscatus TaxID=66883 RepID=UPI0036576E17